MEIIRLYVFTDSKEENEIGVKILHTIEAKKTDKSYVAKGLRIPVDEFESPTTYPQTKHGKLYYDIWTTPENAKKCINECVELILKEFEVRDQEWNKVREAIIKIKAKK